MADAAAETAAVPAKTKKPRAKKGEGKKAKPSTHPPVHDMIQQAIKELKDRKGASLQAIKKYLAANYMCDVVKLTPFIKKALKSGVEKGTYVQTKGAGAAGRFKLKAADKPKREKKKVQKVADEKKAKKPIKGAKKAKKSVAAATARETKDKKPAKAAKKTGERRAKAVSSKTAKKAGSAKKAAKPKTTKAKKPSAKK